MTVGVLAWVLIQNFTPQCPFHPFDKKKARGQRKKKEIKTIFHKIKEILVYLPFICTLRECIFWAVALIYNDIYNTFPLVGCLL